MITNYGILKKDNEIYIIIINIQIKQWDSRK